MTQTTSERERAERLALAKTIIREAGKSALAYFQRYETLEIKTKSNAQDIVSVADTAVETYIRSAISDRFAQDGLVGEEHGHQPGTSPFTWIIDPIDGTSCFLHGLRSWCVVIAVLEHGTPVHGLIYDPCTDELFWASAGQGAFRNDTPIAVDNQSTLAEGLTAIGGSNASYSAHIGRIVTELLAAGGAYMRNGSAALTLAHVAAGHYVAYYQPLLSSWDCVAGLLLVSEAGGVTNDFLVSAGLSEKGDVFAAAPQVSQHLQHLIGQQFYPSN